MKILLRQMHAVQCAGAAAGPLRCVKRAASAWLSVARVITLQRLMPVNTSARGGSYLAALHPSLSNRGVHGNWRLW